MSQNSQENTCLLPEPHLVSSRASNFIEKETLAQVFSCEFCEIFKNTFVNTSGRLLLAMKSDFL